MRSIDDKPAMDRSPGIATTGATNGALKAPVNGAAGLNGQGAASLNGQGAAGLNGEGAGSPEAASDVVTKLKHLLFDREVATLEALARRIELVADTDKRAQGQITERIEQLFERAGTEQRFRASVATVIDGALRDAEVSRHDELSRAVAPLVVRTIKTELRNSQDDLVEALYPMTGRMVKSYVASALKDLAEQINRKLESGLKSNPVSLRLRSWTTGRSMAEVALADTQKLELTDLYLIRRGSGELLQRWPEAPEHANSDLEMSGVLAAINEFATHALTDNGGCIRSFELDNSTVYLRASQAFLLAAKCKGTGGRSVAAVIDEAFLNVIEAHQLGQTGLAQPQRPGTSNGPDAAFDKATAGSPPAVLGGLSAELSKRIEGKQLEMDNSGRMSPLKVIGIVLGVPLAAWMGWQAFSYYEHNKVLARAQEVISGTPEIAGYPVKLEVGSYGQSVGLQGLAPNALVSTALLEDMRHALPDVDVRSELAVLPVGESVAPEVARVRGEIADVRSSVERQAEAIERRRLSVRLKRSIGRLEQASTDLIALKTLIGEPARQARVDAASARTLAASTKLSGLAARLDEPAAKPALPTLAQPLAEVRSDLKAAAFELSGLLGEGGVKQQAARSEIAAKEPTPSDLGELAEDVASDADRVATLAVAIAEVSRMKRPEPQVVVEPVRATPQELLASYVRAHAIFFANNTDFRNDAAARTILAELAQLIKDANGLVRVVGYTDERGGQTRNGPLAQARALRVASELMARGIPASALVALGRPQGPDLSSEIGPDSANRRVEFEVGFKGEPASEASALLQGAPPTSPQR